MKPNFKCVCVCPICITSLLIPATVNESGSVDDDASLDCYSLRACTTSLYIYIYIYIYWFFPSAW